MTRLELQVNCVFAGDALGEFNLFISVAFCKGHDPSFFHHNLKSRLAFLDKIFSLTSTDNA